MTFSNLQKILLAGALLAAAPAAAQPEPIVVSRQDLIDMTEAGLPTSLIVKTIERADVVPTLQPEDLISLQRLGVALEALEAVLDHRPPTKPDRRSPVDAAEAEGPTEEPLAAERPAEAPAVAERPAEAPPETERPAQAPVEGAAPAPTDGTRRVRVLAELDAKRGWFNPFASVGSFAVYWTVSLAGEGTAIAGCPREPICWCADSIGRRTCAEPDDPLWREYLTCHRTVEMQPGESETIFELEIEGPNPEEIRITPFLMERRPDDSMSLEPWPSRAIGPAYLAIKPGAAAGFEAELEVALQASGSKTDIRLATSRFDAGGEAPPSGDTIQLRPAAERQLAPQDLCRP